LNFVRKYVLRISHTVTNFLFYFYQVPYQFLKTTSRQVMVSWKVTSNSFNWYHQERTAEAVNATNGKTVILTPSRLCKLNFFDKFMQSVSLHPKKLDPKTYQSAKSLAKDYQKTKELFCQSLEETTCGKWIGKPYEHDMFGY